MPPCYAIADIRKVLDDFGWTRKDHCPTCDEPFYTEATAFYPTADEAFLRKVVEPIVEIYLKAVWQEANPDRTSCSHAPKA